MNLHDDLWIALCMGFKTISLSEDAYRILKKAKRSPRESFTAVVRRATWEEPAETMGEALDLLESEFGSGKSTVSAEELETSRKLHAARGYRMAMDRPDDPTSLFDPAPLGGKSVLAGNPA